MSNPDPNHPITVTRAPTRVQVLFAGHLLADSGDVLVLKEADYDPVYYFPRKDIEMAVLQHSDHRTHCPYKGDASYFTIMRDATIVENVAWSYVSPLSGRSDIAGRIAFYPQHVEFRVTDTPADLRAEPAVIGAETDVDEVVLHTDSGSGFSQEATWEPTVSEPAQPDPDKPFSGVGAI
jgi:uncharacterized protein (DUF427 family)